MRKFKHLPSVARSYEEQGEIFFACRNYVRQPTKIKKKIWDLCEAAGGKDYAKGLFVYLTTAATWQEVTMEYAMSDQTLYRIRKKFYTLW